MVTELLAFTHVHLHIHVLLIWVHDVMTVRIAAKH